MLSPCAVFEFSELCVSYGMFVMGDSRFECVFICTQSFFCMYVRIYVCACMFESVSCVFGTMTFASGGEVVAPDRSDNSHTLSAGWLELAR